MRCTSNKCWFLHALSVHIVLSLLSAPLWVLDLASSGLLGKAKDVWLTALYPLIKLLPPSTIATAIDSKPALIVALLLANSLCSVAVLTLIRAIIVKRRYAAMDAAASEI